MSNKALRIFAGVIVLQQAITNPAGGGCGRGNILAPAAMTPSCPGRPRPVAGVEAPAGSKPGEGSDSG